MRNLTPAEILERLGREPDSDAAADPRYVADLRWMLVAVTEQRTREEIEAWVSALAESGGSS